MGRYRECEEIKRGWHRQHWSAEIERLRGNAERRVTEVIPVREKQRERERGYGGKRVSKERERKRGER